MQDKVICILCMPIIWQRQKCGCKLSGVPYPPNSRAMPAAANPSRVLSSLSSSVGITRVYDPNHSIRRPHLGSGYRFERRASRQSLTCASCSSEPFCAGGAFGPCRLGFLGPAQGLQRLAPPEQINRTGRTGRTGPIIDIPHSGQYWEGSPNAATGSWGELFVRPPEVFRAKCSGGAEKTILRHRYAPATRRSIMSYCPGRSAANGHRFAMPQPPRRDQ